MSFEHELRAHLSEKAASIEVPGRTLEVTPASHRRPRSWNVVSAVAMIAVAIGGLGYLVTTARTPADRVEVLPTFPLEAAITPKPRANDPLVANRRFVWHQTSGLDASDIVAIGDGFLVFDRAGEEAGAHLQRSTDGAEWTDLGHPIEGEFPAQVSAWRDGAVGVFVDVRTGNLSLWETSDGSEWQQGTKPPTSRTPTQLEILGELDGGLLVHAEYDGSDPLARAIRLSLEGTYSPRDFYIEVSDTTVRVVHQYLLVEVASFDRAEMGWSRGVGSSQPADLGYWWTGDLSTWEQIAPGEIMDDFHPTNVFDTGLTSYLVGRSGSKLYVTEDGEHWDPQPLSSSWLLTERRGEFVAAAYGASEDLLISSDDLRKWEPLDAPDAFTVPAVLSLVESGPLGVAGIVHSRQGGEDAPGAFLFEIADGAAEVIYDLTAGTVALLDGGEAIWTQPMLGIDPGFVTYDPERRAFSYLDPATESVVATVGADDLAARIGEQINQSALLFTTDYESWSVEYLPGAARYAISIGNERLAVIIDNQVWIGTLE